MHKVAQGTIRTNPPPTQKSDEPFFLTNTDGCRAEYSWKRPATVVFWGRLLLSDAETGEDGAEDFVGGNLSGDGAEVVEGVA